MPRITDPDEIRRVAKEALQAVDKATARGERIRLTLEAYCAIADMLEMEKAELDAKRAALAVVRKRLQAREVTACRVRELRKHEAVLKREIADLEARTKKGSWAQRYRRRRSAACRCKGPLQPESQISSALQGFMRGFAVG